MTRPAISTAPSLEDALRYCEEAGGRRPTAAHPGCTHGKVACKRCGRLRPWSDLSRQFPSRNLIEVRRLVVRSRPCPGCNGCVYIPAPKCPLEHP